MLAGFAGTAAISGMPQLARANRLGHGITNPVVFTLKAPDEREIAISEWAPAGRAVGTILFSHGAGSAPDKYLRFFEPWVDAGWRILAPLHVDSREHPEGDKYPGLESWRTRLEDMKALSDHIGDQPYVAAGHSYGGLVALTLGGAAAVPPEGVSPPLGDPKVSAVVAFSPPAPIPVLVTEEGYATLSVPALVQTGTLDIVPGITDTEADGWKGHLVPYTAAAAGNHRYGLVLEGVDHYFGGAICDLDRPGPPQIEQVETAAAISTEFLFAQALGKASAQAALDARISDDLLVRLMTK